MPKNSDMKKALQDALDVLHKVEWAGTQRGQGSSMGSNDGVSVSACPRCCGINPFDPNKGQFIESAHGHRRSCSLWKAIRDIEALRFERVAKRMIAKATAFNQQRRGCGNTKSHSSFGGRLGAGLTSLMRIVRW